MAAAGVFFAFVGLIVYLSAYFQQVQGHSAVRAGLDVAAVGVSYALAATWSGRLTGRIGERWPLVAGLVIAGVATLGLLRLAPGTPLSAIWWNFALLGGGIGLCGTPISAIAMSAVDVPRAGMASAVVNSLRQVGQVFGVAVLGALVYARLPGGAEGARLGPGPGAGLHRRAARRALGVRPGAAGRRGAGRRARRCPGPAAVPARRGLGPGPLNSAAQSATVGRLPEPDAEEITMWNSFRTDSLEGITAEVITLSRRQGDDIHAWVARPDRRRARARHRGRAPPARLG